MRKIITILLTRILQILIVTVYTLEVANSAAAFKLARCVSLHNNYLIIGVFSYVIEEEILNIDDRS